MLENIWRKKNQLPTYVYQQTSLYDKLLITNFSKGVN